MKYALVTGGTGGIGEAVCRILSEDGYHVYINYLNSEKKAIRLADEIGGEAVCFDVSDSDAVRNALGGMEPPELLVNNAGISEIALFYDIADDTARKILTTNLAGTLNCSRAVLPEMIRRKSGNIINISSMWGQVGASCEVDYSASKAGIIGFTKALAKEVAPSGIRVNCISPGFILTEMNSRFSPDDLELIRADIPLGIFGKPRHIADTVRFLASDSSEYITGQIIGVNGGMVI